MNKAKLVILVILNAFFLLSADGGSATWQLDPISSDWSDPANWSPAIVPNGPTDVATFGASNLTDVSLSSDIDYELDSMVFPAGAGSYNISLGVVFLFTISGAGIVNQSDITQNIVLADGGYGELSFTNEASAGTNTT